MSTQSIHIVIPRPKGLRLSPLLRFALSTVKQDGRPALLPMKIPRRCLGRNFKCENICRWQIRDGVNVCYICAPCSEHLWTVYNALDFEIERI
jgi:hypothetical protein